MPPENLVPIDFDWEGGKDKFAIEDARVRLDTLPHRDAQPTTLLVRGGEACRVELISGPENPYRDMWIHSRQTWGQPNDSKAHEWFRMSPAQRMEGVYHILTGQSLPLALELPDFYFEVRNCARYAFDQVVRMRIGVTYSSEGTRDNDVADIPVMIPPRIWDNPKRKAWAIEDIVQAKKGYARQVADGVPWADARALIPQGILHRFAIDINYMSLRNFLGKRMRFCMDLALVDIAWKMYEEVKGRYAVLAAPLRPECDYAQRCTYRAEGRAGEAYSNLFAGCGRHPDPNPVGEFAVSSADQGDQFAWLHDAGYGEEDLVHDGYRPNNWRTAFALDARYFQ